MSFALCYATSENQPIWHTMMICFKHISQPLPGRVDVLVPWYSFVFMCITLSCCKGGHLSQRCRERSTESYRYTESDRHTGRMILKPSRRQGGRAVCKAQSSFNALLTKPKAVRLMHTELRNVGLVQNGRATPGTISSGPRRSSRPNGGKPASGLGSKKRKHSASTSPGNSESQDALDSNTSGGVHFAHCFQQVPCVCC